MTRFNPHSLGPLTYQVALAIAEVREGRTSTAGTTTTVVDTINRTEVADYWNGGTLWMLTDTLTDLAGNFSNITDFASGTLTLGIALDDATWGQEQYAVAGPRFNVWEYIAAVNEAIRGIGKIIYTRTGDITTASGQTEYPLVEKTATDPPPLITYGAEVREVRIQRNTDDSNDNQWVPINTPWHVRKGVASAPGTSPGMPTLIFAQQPPVGYALELTIADEHPPLVLYGQRNWVELDAGIPYRLVVVKAALHLLRMKAGRSFVHPRLNDLTDELKRLEAEQMANQVREYVRVRPQLLNIPNVAINTLRPRREEIP